MNFGFTDEQELFRKTVRQFSDREVRPHYAERENMDYDLRAFLQRMAELGLLGLRVPVEYGGVDTSYVNVGIATEELSRGDYNVGTLIVSSVISTEIISLHATEPVKEEWLPDMVSGRRHVALALTEPHSGSDAGPPNTAAHVDAAIRLLTAIHAKLVT